MGRLPRAHAQTLDWPLKSPCSSACGGGRNLSANDDEVCPGDGGK